MVENAKSAVVWVFGHWWRVFRRGVPPIVGWVRDWLDHQGDVLTAATARSAAWEARKQGVKRGQRSMLRQASSPKPWKRVAAGLSIFVAVVSPFLVVWAEPRVLLLVVPVLALAVPLVGWVVGDEVESTDQPLASLVSKAGFSDVLTSEGLLQALVDARIPGVDKIAKLEGPSCISWVEKPRKTPTGRTGVASLPRGVLASSVVKSMDAMSSATELPLDVLFLEDAPGHAATLRVTVLDRPLSELDPSWPMAGKQVDLFSGFPIGRLPDGSDFNLVLPEQTVVIGGRPKFGKTRAEILIAHATLSSRSEVHNPKLAVIAGKGGGDWLEFEHVCERFVFSEDSDRVAEEGNRIYDWALAEQKRRAKRFERLKAEGKTFDTRISRELAAEPDLGILVLVVDEANSLFSHPVLGKELFRKSRVLAERGPSSGIVQVIGNQSSVGGAIPPRLVELSGVRVGFKMEGHVMNNGTLGPNAHGNGIDATKLDHPGQSLVVTTDGVFDVQWYFVDSRRSVELVRRYRESPESLESESVQVLAALSQCWGDRRGLRPVDAFELIRVADPARFGDWSEDRFRAVVKGYLPKPRSVVDSDGGRCRGWYREDVEAAYRGAVTS